VIPLAQIEAPEIDYLQLAPLLSTVGGSVVVLMVGLLRGRAVQRVLMPLLTLASLVTALVFTIVIWEPGEVEPIVEGALRMDTLALGLSVLFYTAGIFTVLLSLRSEAVRATGAGEYFSLLLASVSGMAVLAAAESLITLFVGFELLSIPLYVLCGSHVRQERSLESGLKYLIIGSVGSATLLYGLALIYGATGATRFSEIATAVGDGVGVTDPLLLTGVALTATGLAFKASIAPFHQWTPDVYQGAPTPVTAFMAVATKAAAFAIFLRLFGDALIDAQAEYGEALAALAWVTIVIGNVGAIAQSSLKRMLAWSGVAQAGYMLVGVLVGTQLGLQATAFYLAVYLLMNVAAFAVVVARERVSEHGDGIRSLEGLGSASPLLAWPMTIAMLALAGFPLTAGFFGKFYLIEAAVEAGWESLGVAIVIGSMLSLVYYLRVVAVMWMGPVEVELPAPPERAPRRVRPVGGWSPEADPRAQPAPVAVAVVTAAATIALGIVPGILFDAAVDVGSSVGMPPL
jgi:NADH-quinone oxidoreductase subunit N